MDYLPLFHDLRGRRCLLVGGGAVALRKARLLVSAGALVRVVAPEILAELRALAQAAGGTCEYEPFAERHLDGAVLVIAATNCLQVNRQVSQLCQSRCLPVNVVDNPALCSVITPAIVDRSPLLIGVTSGGDAPVLARLVRSRLESLFPAAWGRAGSLASRFRGRVKTAFADGDARRRFWEAVFDGPVFERVLAGDEAGAEALLTQALDAGTVPAGGEVYLVGAGPGDPDLLTFKALRLMQKAEVVLYDRLVSEPILNMTRRDAERIYVGKQKSHHTLPQTEINQLLVELALAGKRVLRLKGGDPFIFGRGGEELELLAAHDIPFQVVPGITAASGCASYAGIPLTHRDCAQSVRFVTGHRHNGSFELPAEAVAATGETLVVYMGLTGLDAICQQLIAAGRAPITPAALIERGTLPEQRVHATTLARLPEVVAAAEVRAPTLLIVGEVVALRDKLNWYGNSRADRAR